MKVFTADTKRVRIAHLSSKHRKELIGRTGMVLGLIETGGAWVELDGDRIPDRAAYFPGEHEHHNTIVLYPFECEEVA